MAVTEAGCFWAADLLWRVDMMAMPRARHAQDGQHARHPHDAAERVLRPQRQDRLVEHTPPRARPSLRDRRRQHHVGQRLPAPRGHVAVHARVPEGPVLGHPRRRDRADPRAQPGRLLRLRPRRGSSPIADRIGPTPERPRPDRRVGVRQVGAVQEGGRPWLTGEEAGALAHRQCDARNQERHDDAEPLDPGARSRRTAATSVPYPGQRSASR